MSKRRYVPLRVHVSDETLMGLHEKLANGKLSTFAVRDWLEDHEGDKPNPPYCVVALPVPTGNKPVLQLNLRIWHHLRSPTWEVKRRFRPMASAKTILRCQDWLQEQARMYDARPTIGGEWSDYLWRGVNLLAEDEPSEPADGWWIGHAIKTGRWEND